MNQILGATGGFLNLSLELFGEMPEMYARWFNALSCSMNNIGENSWNLVAATYWTMVGVGEKATIEEYLNVGYEYICTCGKDGE